MKKSTGWVIAIIVLVVLVAAVYYLRNVGLAPAVGCPPEVTTPCGSTTVDATSTANAGSAATALVGAINGQTPAGAIGALGGIPGAGYGDPGQSNPAYDLQHALKEECKKAAEKLCSGKKAQCPTNVPNCRNDGTPFPRYNVNLNTGTCTARTGAPSQPTYVMISCSDVECTATLVQDCTDRA